METKSFEVFLASPYFNKNADVLFSYQLLLKFMEAKSNKKPLEIFIANAYQKKGKKIGVPGIKKHLTIIIKLALEFLSIESFRQNEIPQQIKILQTYHEKSEKQEFVKLYEKLKLEISDLKADVSKYKFLHEIEELYWFLQTQIAETRKGDANLEIKKNAFSKYYLVEKLWTSIAIISRKNEVNIALENESINALILKIEEGSSLKDNFIKILYLAYKMLSEKGKDKIEFFNEFVKHLELYGNEFKDDKTRNFYNLVRAEASIIYSNSNDLYRFLFQLYKIQIDNKSIYNNEEIHYGIFKNIITVGIKLKEFEWLENFVASHKALILQSKISEDICAFNLARIHFFKKDFVKANQFIAADRIKDPFYKISMKRLELMLFFELKEWIVLDAAINTSKVALSKNRNTDLTEIRRTYELSFINVLYRMSKIFSDVNNQKNKLQILLKDVKQMSELSEKQWIIEKLNAYEFKT